MSYILNKHKAMKLMLTVIIIAVLVVAAAADYDSETKQVLPGCSYTCGKVRVPYPFGIGYSNQRPCFLDASFQLACIDTKLMLGDFQVLSINVSDSQMEVLFDVSTYCNGILNYAWLDFRNFRGIISSKENKFISVGCNTYGYLNSIYNGEEYSTGCLTRCSNRVNITDIQLQKEVEGNCSGIGCCQVDILPGMKNITIEAHEFENSADFTLGKCSYSFVAKRGNYTFSVSHLNGLPFKLPPMVVDWSAGDGSCDASKGRDDYACQQKSACEDSEFGYRCRCEPGYEGNPYHPDGCIDIDECLLLHPCNEYEECKNFPGSHLCSCKVGYEKNNNGTSCQPKVKTNTVLVITLSVTSSLLVALVVSMNIYWGMQKRKLMKLREKFFQQNGGIFLQQQIESLRHGGSSNVAKIFTIEELNKVTNNFDQSRVVGKGGQGTVYKGTLPNNTVVAIKKANMCDQNQIQQFINEMIVLFQINHRNVVKLLGCCLETEVPLLIYEFITNGTLSGHLHNQSENSSKLSWRMRLGIATEIAGALAYLHSATSTPIIHRDVKTTNILLDHNLTAKISDFGASRFFPLDKSQLTTLVQGTLGYLDPEYFHSSQLTEKSDVYSFGVVLTELLTSKKAITFDNSENYRSLSNHFESSMITGNLLQIVDRHIMDEANVEQIMEAANLARRCLRVKGEDRPSMKEVSLELEGLMIMEKHTWGEGANVSSEETEHLLNTVSHDNGVACGGDGVSGSGTINSMEISMNKISVHLEYGR